MKNQRFVKRISSENPLNTEAITIFVEAIKELGAESRIHLTFIGGHYPSSEAAEAVINDALGHHDRLDEGIIDLDGAVGLRDALDAAIRALSVEPEAPLGSGAVLVVEAA